MNNNDEQKEQITELEAGSGPDVVPTRPLQTTLEGKPAKRKKRIEKIYDDGIGQIWARRNDNGMYGFVTEVKGKKFNEITIPELAKDAVISFLERY